MNVGPAPTPSHPLIPSAARAALEVRVVRDAPRIAFVWPEQPEPHEVYATACSRAPSSCSTATPTARCARARRPSRSFVPSFREVRSDGLDLAASRSRSPCPWAGPLTPALRRRVASGLPRRLRGATAARDPRVPRRRLRRRTARRHRPERSPSAAAPRALRLTLLPRGPVAALLPAHHRHTRGVS